MGDEGRPTFLADNHGHENLKTCDLSHWLAGRINVGDPLRVSDQLNALRCIQGHRKWDHLGNSKLRDVWWDGDVIPFRGLRKTTK
ncbi:hypothetical protein NDU88_003509 [Pleurodeles waltl]|uniref:Uncharacterized protein n=1 Tax=Pleurodeles waltl TaxID=8319 RepID=A0AAV7LFI9_PLEWA|nr:hypothetical protein NDU88_003509 [Pleurodeles waltl]